MYESINGKTWNALLYFIIQYKHLTACFKFSKLLAMTTKSENNNYTKNTVRIQYSNEKSLSLRWNVEVAGLRWSLWFFCWWTLRTTISDKCVRAQKRLKMLKLMVWDGWRLPVEVQLLMCYCIVFLCEKLWIIEQILHLYLVL